MNVRTRGAGVRLCLALVLLMLGACTVAGPAPRTPVKFASTACPDDVMGELRPPLQVSCGLVTVPEHHADPDGATVHAFVARVRGHGDVAPDPMIVIGGNDIAAAVHYADDIAVLPGRIGREVIVLEPRGTGHGRPALTCPEIDVFDEHHVGRSLEDPAVGSAFTAAVTACGRRLQAEGANLSAFTLEESAADVAGLATALELDSFNVGTYGFNSKIAIELLRTSPPGLRSVYMDSPVYADETLFSMAVAGTESAIAAVGEACAQQPECETVLPRLSETVHDVVTALQRDPMAVESGATVVELDGAMAARTIRDWLSFAPGVVPAEIRDLAAGDGGDIAGHIASSLSSCFGYWLFCRSGEAPAGWGVLFSIACPDATGVATARADTTAASGLLAPAARHPYVDACQGWPVESQAAPSGNPALSDVPILVLHGEFDPFSTPPGRAALAPMAHAYAYVFAGQSTNVLGHGEAGCAREIRAAFVADPRATPDASCLATVGAPMFSP